MNLAIIIIVVAAAVSVLTYMVRAERNAAQLALRDVTLRAEQERRHATEKAEAEADAARKVAYDKIAHEARTAHDAARLLREAGDGATS